MPFDMSGIVLSPNKLDPVYMKNREINGHISESETVSDSDSEIENDLDIEKNTEILKKLEMHQKNTNKLGNILSTPNVSNEKNALSNNVTNITVQNSSNTRFGNETNFNAPVTISHAEVNQIYQSKTKGKYPIRKIICFLIAAIVIFSVLTLILILRHKEDGEDDEEDDESIISDRFFELKFLGHLILHCSFFKMRNNALCHEKIGKRVHQRT